MYEPFFVPFLVGKRSCRVVFFLTNLCIPFCALVFFCWKPKSASVLSILAKSMYLPAPFFYAGFFLFGFSAEKIGVCRVRKSAFLAAVSTRCRDRLSCGLPLTPSGVRNTVESTTPTRLCLSTANYIGQWFATGFAERLVSEAKQRIE